MNICNFGSTNRIMCVYMRNMNSASVTLTELRADIPAVSVLHVSLHFISICNAPLHSVPLTISEMRLTCSGFFGFFTVYTPSSPSPTSSITRWLRCLLSFPRALSVEEPLIRTTSGDRGADLFRNVTSTSREGSRMWKSSPWNKVMESSSTGIIKQIKEEKKTHERHAKHRMYNWWARIIYDVCVDNSFTFYRGRESCKQR